ncbi:MAG: hypothetical protein GY832_11745 [Chloroflexi bacterium]|nr:hypothetical protein [Chloroflexota bacterium]
MAKKADVVLLIPPLKMGRIKLRLIGDSFLIPHAWSEKAKRMIRDKTQKKARGAREAKDPMAEGSASLYWLDKDGYTVDAGTDYTKHKTGFGLPCRAIKASAQRAAVDVEGVAMTQIKRSLFVLPKHADACVRIMSANGKKPAQPVGIREDLMRVGGKGPGTGSADLRYRGEFRDWSVDVEIEFMADLLSAEVIVNLLNRAGTTCGLLEDRPERTGGYGGMFHVETRR